MQSEDAADPASHRHKEVFTESKDFGCAVTDVFEYKDGTLWASNGEYTNQISFCPFCGYEAKLKAEADPDEN